MRSDVMDTTRQTGRSKDTLQAAGRNQKGSFGNRDDMILDTNHMSAQQARGPQACALAGHGGVRGQGHCGWARESFASKLA
eukprot:763916-Hanusia_phi.AAC.5